MGQDAAVSTIPGVVFSGGWDGVCERFPQRMASFCGNSTCCANSKR